ncbi:MAG TPA: hypothetical protein VIV88_17650 [Gemmatimonadales bacterium]|jgi:hypothetical protein
MRERPNHPHSDSPGITAVRQRGEEGHEKDAILDSLARRFNVAQFVSFDPALKQRYAWIRGYSPNHEFDSVESAVAAILAASPERSVNIRSFQPDNPKGREFIYGQTSVPAVVSQLHRLAAEDLLTIVNETVDVNDGGVSGVAYGDAIEFAPKDTPRCVEKPGTASVTRRVGLRIFERVYHFKPALPDRRELRVEFSLHPLRRGYQYDHTIIWEVEEVSSPPTAVEVSWPNLFSRFVGDKAYGLLVADAIGLRVPRAVVIPRGLAPFTIGSETGLAETWIRTCPTEQVPGRFTTRRGWLDPFRLMQDEDPTGDAIASILAQEGIEAKYSGALIAQTDREPLVEGVTGYGDEFMVGRRAPESLPASIVGDVHATYRQASKELGPVRFEWVHDGRSVWIVQFHSGASATAGRVIFPGEAARYHEFDVKGGIEALRKLIDAVKGSDDGIVLVGRVGVTSHFGDLLRRARVPSRIEYPES